MNTKWIIILIFSSLVLPLTSFANESDCSKDSIECTYVTGLNEDDFSDGRYLKIQVTHNKDKGTYILCFNNASVLEIDKEEAASSVGKIEVTASICTDPDGNKCELIKEFYTQITKIDENNYVANPAHTQIDLSPYAARYVRCDGTQSLNFKTMIKSH